MTPERHARIKSLFTSAMDLRGDQRREFLARECGDDVALRREVESLLEHDDSQTIIVAHDQTVSDLSRLTVAESSRPTLSRRLYGFRSLTAHLGPRGYLALGALISCIILTLLAYAANHVVLQFQKQLRREALNEIVDGKVMALEMWLEHEAEKIESWARSDKLRRHTAELVRLAYESQDNNESLRDSPLQPAIAEELRSLAGRQVKYAIWDRRNVLIADSFSDVDRLGSGATPWGASALAMVFSGTSHPFSFDQSHVITEFDPSFQVEPHMGTITPVRDEDERIIAALLVHDPDSRSSASRILEMFRLGESGETYVFNREGLMLTESRFDDQLRDLGLILADPNSSSARTLRLHDPGGDLTAGYLPNGPLSAQPLTKMARLCTAENDGDDLDGYRDYRGVKVVGAWRWLEQFDVGVATELDLDEAEPGLRILVWETWIIIAMFALCFSIALLSYYSVYRMRHQVGEKLGQYTLEKQIGEGGMGKVYKARHELLKRPTAIKLLKPELADPDSVARFAREARLVSQLLHPNTINVYDYGTTPHGLFYYVMEYIDGLSLAELVDLETSLSPSRVVHLLRQVCCSLREAHDAGLVHRDLKPANIMVSERGGEFDVVTVLDFGLVKHVETTASQKITSTALVAGTPQYIAPERLQSPDTDDPRSDIYSFGTVAFFLLTGHDFVSGGSLAEILLQVVSLPPTRPSSRTKTKIPPLLDELVYDCLAKDPDDRPSNVTEIIAVLDDIDFASPWTRDTAKLWWMDVDCRLGRNTADS